MFSPSDLCGRHSPIAGLSDMETHRLFSPSSSYEWMLSCEGFGVLTVTRTQTHTKQKPRRQEKRKIFRGKRKLTSLQSKHRHFQSSVRIWSRNNEWTRTWAMKTSEPMRVKEIIILTVRVFSRSAFHRWMRTLTYRIRSIEKMIAPPALHSIMLAKRSLGEFSSIGSSEWIFQLKKKTRIDVHPFLVNIFIQE